MLSTLESEATLTVRRTYPVPRSRLFKAWSDPSDLMKWFAPPGLDTPVADIDFRVGGKYRFGMRRLDEGSIIFVSGTYREIVPDSKIVFSWSFETVFEVKDSIVTIDLLDAPGGTELVLTHELLPTKKERDSHESGWAGILEKLAASMES